MERKNLTVRELIEVLQRQDPKATPLAWVAYTDENGSTSTAMFGFCGQADTKETLEFYCGDQVLLSVGPHAKGPDGQTVAEVVELLAAKRRFEAVLQSIGRYADTISETAKTLKMLAVIEEESDG
jgi:hypothetical protein